MEKLQGPKCETMHAYTVQDTADTISKQPMSKHNDSDQGSNLFDILPTT